MLSLKELLPVLLFWLLRSMQKCKQQVQKKIQKCRKESDLQHLDSVSKLFEDKDMKINRPLVRQSKSALLWYIVQCFMSFFFRRKRSGSPVCMSDKYEQVMHKNGRRKKERKNEHKMKQLTDKERKRQEPFLFCFGLSVQLKFWNTIGCLSNMPASFWR